MRMAVAMVCGEATGSPRTIGAAPAAWKPSMRGRCVVLLVAHPVGGDVAGVADGKAVRVRRDAEGVDDLERGGLLAVAAGSGSRS